MKKKAIVAVVALVLVLCCAMGGTLAWLVAKTDPVVNTFTYGDINISLWEHELNEDGLTLNDTKLTETGQTGFKMIPGNNIEKDPTVTVKANSEACWLFVKVVKSDNFDDFMEYSIATGWTALNDKNADGVADDGVYYRTVAATTVDRDFDVLKDKTVSVKKDVTKDKLNALREETMPTLTFTAYAIQSANLTNADNTEADTAVEAWALIEQ